MTEAHERMERAKVIEVARSMLKTPWRHMGRTREGVDCGGLLIVVFRECGIVPPDFETGFYPPDFMLHSGEQRFVGFVERFARKVDREPRDGDVAMFQVGRSLAHCAIVDQWPRVIHAVRSGGIVCFDDALNGPLKRKFAGVWSPLRWS
jgi:cell wall-associated NlpC family hydrolase